MKLKEQPGVPVPPPTGQPYHGYTTKGKPIPKRSSLHIHQQCPAVPPASAHGTGHHPGLHDESQPSTTTGQPARNAHAYDVGMSLPTRSLYEALSLEELLEDDEEEYAARLPTSGLRRDLPEGWYTQGNTQLHVQYGAPPAPQPAPITARQGNAGRDKRVTESRREKGGVHWLVLFGVGMVVMLVLWVLGSLALAWVQTKWEDLAYGYPRTFQCDAVVGHNHDSPARPSHFIALNLHRQIQVMEEPAGDPTQARVYVVLTLVGDGQELTPVTLSFKDVTGDGKPDMLIHIQGQTVVYVNENGQFRPQRPGEQISL